MDPRTRCGERDEASDLVAVVGGGAWAAEQFRDGKYGRAFDPELALRALQAGCNGADPRSCLYAARAFYDDDETRARPERRQLLQRACDRGVAEGCIEILIDRLQQDGRGVAAALGTLDQLCTRGEPRACIILALHLGHATTPRRAGTGARAVVLTIRACDLGDRDGCMLAGQRYDRGQDVAKDDDVKRSYFGRACDRGAGLGCLYLAQDAVLTPSREDRVAGFAQRACELGEAEGCVIMVRSQIEQHADAAADRWAIEGCRLRSWYSCERLVARDLEIPRVPAGWTRQLFQLGCGEDHQSACRALASLEQAEEPVLRAMHEAVARKDATAFARLASSSVDLYGLWFDSPDCAKQFSGEVTLTAGAHPAFLACLSSHGLRFDPRASADRSAALVYDPGVVLTVDLVDGAIARITGPQLPWQRASAAAISPMALASHLVAGTHAVEPDRAARDAIAAFPDAIAAVHLHVCVDATGKLEEARVAKSPHSNDNYARAVEAAAAAWRFKPFEVGGKAVPVCTDDVFVYPADRWRSAVFERSSIGLPANGSLDPRNVAPWTLESLRIAGDKLIVPDDQTKAAISLSGKNRLVGSFKLCITTEGQVASVVRLKSTGVPSYDEKIERELHTWRYSPFWIDGRPVKACTAVTFIYSQH
jgi:TPR repeat protein